MESIKQSKEYSIWKKRSGRHAVKNASGNFVHGDEKLQILIKEGITKLSVKKAKPEEKPAE